MSSNLIATALPCRVLFTTRNRDQTFSSVEVSVLPESFALQLLLGQGKRRDRLNPEHPEHEYARQICAQVGYLPLALEICMAFLAEWDEMPLTDFAQRLVNEGCIGTLDEELAELPPGRLPAIHRAGLGAILRAQWKNLPDDATRYLLRVAGQLAEAAQIPVAQLALLSGMEQQSKPGRPSPFDRTLKRLSRSSLVEELSEEQIRLHPLVREFAASQTPADEASTFRAQCVGNLHRAYCDIGTLEDHVDCRGVLAVERDIITGLLLNFKPVDNNEQSAIADLQALLTLLQRQSHIVRSWERTISPATLAQQLLLQAEIMAIGTWRERFRNRLQQGRSGHLSLQWRTGHEAIALRRTLAGHTLSISRVTVMPDRQRIISSSEDGTIKIWNLPTGEVERTVFSHIGMVTCVAVTPDGRYIVYATSDNTLRIWNLLTEVEVRALTGHTATVTSLVITPDGKSVISASKDKTLKVWDLTTYIENRTLSGHTGTVTRVAVTPDGRRIISASEDKTLKIWNLATGVEENTLAGHSVSVMDIAVTHNSQNAVSVAGDSTIKIWDLSTGMEICALSGHTAMITSVAVTPDGQHIVSASGDGMIKIWNLSTGKAVSTFAGQGVWLTSVTVTLDGQYIVAAYEDGTLKIWNLVTIASEYTPNARYKWWILALAVTLDGEHVISASFDGVIKAWNLATGSEECIFANSLGWVNGIAMLSDGQRMISTYIDGRLNIWNLATGKVEYTFTNQAGEAIRMAVTPDGPRAVFVSSDQILRIWNLDTRMIERVLTAHAGKSMGVAVTPNGQHIVSVSNNRTIKIWNLATSEEERTIADYESTPLESVRMVSGILVATDGQHIVSTPDDRTLKVWSLATGEEKRTLVGNKSIVRDILVTPDGQRVIAVSDDHTLKVWNLTNERREVVAEITLTLDCPLHSVAIAPDGMTIVVGDRGGNLYCFRLVMGALG